MTASGAALVLLVSAHPAFAKPDVEATPLALTMHPAIAQPKKSLVQKWEDKCARFKTEHPVASRRAGKTRRFTIKWVLPTLQLGANIKTFI